MNKILLLIISLIVIHIISTYNSHTVGKKYNDANINKCNAELKIYDAMHEILPNYYKNSMLNIIKNCLMIGPFLMFPQITNEFLQYFLPIVVFRDITTNSTILPKYSECNDDKFSFHYLMEGHCHDKIFSGHYVWCTLITQILYNQHIVTSIPLLVMYQFLVALLILLVRDHYTIDIIMGFYVAMTSYHLNLSASNIVKMF
jgi:hypothetical protein